MYILIFIDEHDQLKKSGQTSQEFTHLDPSNTKLLLQKETSNISFDQNHLFESLNLAKVESKNYNFLIEPDNKTENILYPGINPEFMS